MVPLPPELAEFGANCPNCTRRVSPDFWTRRDDPFGPVFPKGTKGEKGAWVQAAIVENCPCGAKVSISLSPKQLDTPIFYLGDEAVREHGKRGFYIYTIIGGTTGPHTKWSKRLSEIKKTFVPSLEPTSWTLHATKISNGYYREKNAAFQHLSKDDVGRLLEAVASVVRDLEEYSWNMCAITPYFRPKDKAGQKRILEEARVSTHAFLTSAAIYRSTRQGLRPKFIFDATAPFRKSPHIEAWSFNNFEENKHYLGYELISHGNAIAPPEFVKPGSKPSLELADAHAFLVGRQLYSLMLGKNPDLDPSIFGKFYYMVVKGPNYADFKVGSNIPTEFLDDFLP